MKIAPPITIAEGDLTSNVVETPPAAYSGATSYDTGDQVSIITGTVAAVYQSLIDANLGNDPASSPDEWESVGTAYEVYAGGPYDLDDIVTDAANHRLFQSLKGSNSAPLPSAAESDANWGYYGPTNRWAMFDEKTGTQTTRPGEIAVTIAASGRVTMIGLINIDAAAANVTVYDSTGLTELYNEDFSLVSTEGEAGWFNWSFEPIVRYIALTIDDLPNVSNPKITVTLTGEGNVSIGHLDAGWGYDIGGTERGAKIGITDHSEKVQDSFGNYYLLERDYNDRGSFTVEIDKVDVDRIKTLLTSLRAKPALIVGSELHRTAIYHALAWDWDIQINDPAPARLTIQTEGL